MKRQNKNKTYFWLGIPAIVDNIHLHSNDRIILMMIYTYLHQKRYFMVSNRTLSLLTGYKPKTISKIISRLKKQGWIYATTKMHTFPNGSHQWVRIVYGINQDKLHKSTKEVAKRVGNKHVFRNNHTNKGGILHREGILPQEGTPLKEGNASHSQRMPQGSPKTPKQHQLKNKNNILSNKPSYSNNSLRLQNRNRKNTKSKIEDKYLGTNIKLESYSNGLYKAPSTVFNTLSLLFRHFKHNIEYLHTSQSSINKCRTIISGWCDDSQDVRDDALNAIVKSVFNRPRRFPNILYLVKVIDNNYVQKFQRRYIDKQRAADKEQKELARDQKDIQSGIHRQHIITANNILAEYHDGIIETKAEDLKECTGQDPIVKKIVVAGLKKMK